MNGQKVWTSSAHLAKRALLVARTDPDVPKHQGLTYFACDMTVPGVEVRPLRQATGEAEFNEVFLTDVPIPDTDRIGEVGDGWKVATTTLMNERVSIARGCTTGCCGCGPTPRWPAWPEPGSASSSRRASQVRRGPPRRSCSPG